MMLIHPNLKMQIIKRKREKLQAELVKLRGRHRELMRGRVVPNTRATNVQIKINEIERQIEALDRDAAERFALEKAPIDEVLQIIAIPLLADVLNDLVAGVNGMLRRNGLQETVFQIYASQIQRAALAIVDTLDHADKGLPKLLEHDDTLIDAIEKKLMSFIKQRLNITD